MSDDHAEPEYITVAQAERIFSLPRNSGYAMVYGAWAPFAVRLGNRIRINRAELMKWAAANQGK
jgi:hypothetical protein